jgi:type VI secretion system secreted protein Hcp
MNQTSFYDPEACIVVLAAGMAAAKGRELSMAMDIFLRLDTIPGESRDFMFKGQIDVLKVSSGLQAPVQLDTSGLSIDGRAAADRLVVAKWVDVASVPLAKALVTGGRLAAGRITFRKAGETPLVFLTLDLRPVLVADISSETSGGEDRPLEQVTLAFGEVQWTYTRQNPDGSTSPPTKFAWSFINNSSVPPWA